MTDLERLVVLAKDATGDPWAVGSSGLPHQRSCCLSNAYKESADCFNIYVANDGCNDVTLPCSGLCRTDAEFIAAARNAVPAMERAAKALREILALVEQLPSGIDEEADPADLSPPDMAAHVGGLIAKVAREVLRD